MSTIIMAACWPLQGMSPSQKAVLISLADQANDDGVCWPAVGTIAARTCLSERAVRDALAWLQAAGAVFREYRHNTSTSYTVCPKRFDPAKAPAESKRTTKRKTDVAANAAPPAAAAPGADAAPPANAAVPPANAAPAPADAAGLEGQMPPPNHQLNRHLTANESSPPALQSGRGGAGQAENTEETALQAACRETWAAYSFAFEQRYGVKPVRNAPVNANVKALVKRLGHEEAPLVAAWYVANVNEAFVVKNSHGMGVLVNQAEGYRTQWACGQAVTATAAQAADKSSANFDAIEEAKRLTRQRKEGGNA
ncbi:helix-turn-helix domain-containing protein [Comamonas sp. F1-6]|uniref:helix-turn-helix domain-containing protein n=1 Tax=Comamonas sp. F1-6 TaxID=673550 RepID=UPI0031CF598C